MAWFRDPADPPGTTGSGLLLLKNGGLVLDLFGWMTAAVGVAETGTPIVWISLLGAGIGLFQLRAAIVTAVVEIALLAALFALAPADRMEWVGTAAALIVTARALGWTFRRLARARGDAPLS